MKKSVSELLNFDKVNFAQVLYQSKFYEALEAIDGIAYVNITEFRRENPSENEETMSGKIKLGPK